MAEVYGWRWVSGMTAAFRRERSDDATSQGVAWEVALGEDPLRNLSPAARAWFKACFAAPTPVQVAAWPAIGSGGHALLIAPTGSGKTLAAFLSALDRLASAAAEDAGYRVVYVSPLKALAVDVDRNLRAPIVGIQREARRLGLPAREPRVDVRTGDTPQRERARMKRRPGDVLVTTPESLYLMLTSQSVEVLRRVEVIILDEIHVLAGTKRGVHLALTVERLVAARLEGLPPLQRVGLSATVRPVSTAARFLGGSEPVEVIDTSARPDLDLEVVVPVADMSAPPPPNDPWREPSSDAASDMDPFEDDRDVVRIDPTTPNAGALTSGIWPAITPRLLDLIRSHRSTLLFVNSRLLCERLAQALNELAREDLVRAHHGSISHEQRALIEDDLKAGRLPALVATSSLELGIDMGAIDLVVLVSSPGSVASGLQRAGRAGHQVNVASVARIFPKYRGDLVECAVVSQFMTEGRIESTRMPENCLDVLAQQIVAIVSEGPVGVDEVFALVRRAAPYAALPRAALTAVLDMLSGRYPSDAFADLRPSITWDRTTDVLTPRRGARSLAVLNGGTIPDRGLYRVRAGAGGPRIGELDEEMVYESRPRDVIILGASAWRVEDITRDEVIVSPAPGQPGRLPFWRGESPGRPIELGRALGAFLRELATLGADAATEHLRSRSCLDALAAHNLLEHLKEQREATGVLPTDRTVVIERFRDELGDWRLCILTPFGAPVHAPWGLAIQARLSEQAGFDASVFWSDDGIALRLSDGDELPPLSTLLPEPEDVRELVLEQIRSSALFAARFRECAGRALLLPRRRPAGRTPLWMQRKRAADLLAAAGQHGDFPIVLETLRECLRDVFDLDALNEVLTAVRSREIRVVEVETRSASPFARSLVFQYLAAYLYDGDAPLAERRAAALTLDRKLLAELLGQDGLRDVLDADAIAEVEDELTHRAQGRHVTHPDALHDLLRRLGDLNEGELAERCAAGFEGWLTSLSDARRVIQVRVASEARWIAAEDAGRYREALGVTPPPGLPQAFLEAPADALRSLLLRYARHRGPFTTEEPAQRYSLRGEVVDAILRQAEADGVLVRGALRPGGAGTEWVDAEVLRRLRRRSLAKLRKQIAPVDADALARFLPRWQGVGGQAGGLGRLLEVIDQLEGLPIAASALEDEVLPARVAGFNPLLLDQAGAMGEVLWLGKASLGPKDGRVALYRRERASLLADPPATPSLSPVHQRLLARLETRGACFLVELHAAAESDAQTTHDALWDLVWAGLVTNDTFQPLRGLRGSRGRRRVPTAGGRWSCVAPALSDPPPQTERLLATARSLLARYGVVSREVAAHERVAGGFSAIYPVLRAMEDAGQVRRGWFIDGLGGAQFALPGAVDRLRMPRGGAEASDHVQILAADDPAQPYGGLLPWPPTALETSAPRRVSGAKVVLVGGHPILYVSRGARGLTVFRRALHEATELRHGTDALRDERGYRSLRIERLDGVLPAESPSAIHLVEAGFLRDGTSLRLGRHP